MSKKSKQKSLSWDAFQSMGNPENAEAEKLEEESESNLDSERAKDVVRVYLERKNRGGKTATVIKGIMDSEKDLLSLTKELKSALGVGGSMKNGEIILQGDKRKKAVEFLKKIGFANTKNAGA